MTHKVVGQSLPHHFSNPLPLVFLGLVTFVQLKPAAVAYKTFKISTDHLKKSVRWKKTLKCTLRFPSALSFVLVLSRLRSFSSLVCVVKTHDTHFLPSTEQVEKTLHGKTQTQ